MWVLSVNFCSSPLALSSLDPIALPPFGHHGAGALRADPFFLLTGLAVDHLDHLVLRSATHHDDRGVADELGVDHLLAETGDSVVEDDFNPAARVFGVEVFGDALDVEVLVVGRHDHDLVGRDRTGPDHAVFVVAAVLFDSGLQAPRCADSVAAHHGHDQLTVVTVNLHDLSFGLAVNRLELEDVPQFDTAPLLEDAVALGATVALLCVVERNVPPGSRQIHADVHVQQVVVLFVAPAQEVLHPLHGLVEDDLDILLESDGAREPDGRAGDLEDRPFVGELECLTPAEVSEFDFVDLSIAPNANCQGRAVGHVDDGLHHQ